MLDKFEHQIIALYSKGMTTRDIQEILTEMYRLDVNPSLISKITDKLLSEIEEWRSRPLKEKYFIV